MVEYESKLLWLSEVGSLADGERALIKEWLVDNFCDEGTFGCELQELDNGGFALPDAEERVGQDEDSFGVRVVSGDDGSGFLAVLFDVLPQGIMIDRSGPEVVAQVIEGELTDVSDGYEERVRAICKAVPILQSVT